MGAEGEFFFVAPFGWCHINVQQTELLINTEAKKNENFELSEKNELFCEKMWASFIVCQNTLKISEFFLTFHRVTLI